MTTIPPRWRCNDPAEDTKRQRWSLTCNDTVPGNYQQVAWMNIYIQRHASEVTIEQWIAKEFDEVLALYRKGDERGFRETNKVAETTTSIPDMPLRGLRNIVSTSYRLQTRGTHLYFTMICAISPKGEKNPGRWIRIELVNKGTEQKHSPELIAEILNAISAKPGITRAKPAS